MAIPGWIYEKAKKKIAVFEEEAERKRVCLKANICWRCGRNTKDSLYKIGRIFKKEILTIECPTCGIIEETNGRDLVL